MRETNVLASTYAKHYDSTWGRLMKKQERFPLEEYGDRSVLTTWTISYEQVRKQSEEAAWLLKLWGFLDNGELWYELVAACNDLAAETDVPTWLLEVAKDELSFAEVMGLLSCYSLVDGKEGTEGHSMHSVLHRWCSSLVEEEERAKLGCLATALVALNVPLESDTEFWKKRKRMMAHGLRVSGWIVTECKSGGEGAVEALMQPGSFYSLGYLLNEEDRQRAEQMYQRALAGYEKASGPQHTSTLNTVNNLGLLYADLGRLEQAEQMYQRALAGYEKTWGLDHTSTLDTVNNLGNLYKTLGRLEEAEQMYQRALAGKEKAWGPQHTSTLNTVNNLGNLYADLGRLEQAEQMYQRALAGYEKASGPQHTSTLDTVNNLGLLYADLGRLEEAEQMYQRALAGYAKAIYLDNLLTCVPALNNMWAFASLRQGQGRIEDARHWYSHALLGYEKTFGERSEKCQTLRDNLAALASEEGEEEGEGELDVSTNIASVQRYTSTYSEVGVRLPPAKLAPRRNRLLRKLRWKQKQGKA
jgi:tetratricopeptide (TPR) repeat protein